MIAYINEGKSKPIPISSDETELELDNLMEIGKARYIKYQRPKLIGNPVICVCHLTDNGKEKMVQCNDCQDWLHPLF